MSRKAVLYGRFSSNEQEDGNSRDRQEELAYKIAQQEELEIVKVYFDEGKSGYHGHNLEGEFGQLLRDIESDEIIDGDILLVEELDRLSRQHLFKAQKQLTGILDKGVEIWTYLNGSLCKYNRDNPMLLLQAIVKSQLAFEESDKKSARAKDNWKRKYADIAAGKFTRVKMPYWISADYEKEEFYLSEYKDGISVIFEKYTSGIGLVTIVNYLNDNCYPLPKRQVKKHQLKWTRHRVLQVLKHHAVYGRFSTEDNSFVKSDYYPAVITKDAFDLAASIRKAHGNKSKQKSSYVNPLSGLIQCPYCGHGFVLNYTTSRGKRYYSFNCNSGSGKSGCFAPSISARKLEPVVFKYLTDIDWSSLFKDNGLNKDKLISDLDSAKKELTRLEELFESSGFNIKLGEAVAAQQINVNNKQKELDEIVEVEPNFDFNVQELLESDELRSKAAIKLRLLVDKIELYTCGEMLDFREIPGYSDETFKQAVKSGKANNQHMLFYFKSGEKRQVGISSDYVAGVTNGVVYDSGRFEF